MRFYTKMSTIIRGATTINHNNKAEMQEATLELYNCIVEKNILDINEISCIIFACTKDLTCGNPATFLRLNKDEIKNIPLLSLEHHNYRGSLKKCIRILIATNQPIKKPQHIYLRKAKKLREDLTHDQYSN